MPMHVIALRYALFAVIATVLNLATQMAVFALVPEPNALAAALMAGSTVGIVVKYLLDKRWIFLDTDRRLIENSFKFAKYAFFGIFTTAIFWVTEITFDLIFDDAAMRYVGAIIGLTIGYATKYCLDQRYVFTLRGAET